jgi:hypothetical protein
MGNLRWSEILPDNLVQSARHVVRGIASEIESLDLADCVAWQLCDRALLAGYLALSDPAGEWRSQAIVYLNAAGCRVRRSLPTNLFSGLSCVGWTLEHLGNILAPAGTWGVDLNKEGDPLQEIESLILRRLERSRWNGPYDLIGGLVGIGVFFLERLPLRTASQGVSLILDRMEEQVEESSCGITWRTPARLLSESLRRDYPAGYYNLGVAHGIPGVVQFLGEVVASGLEARRALRLLEGSVKWMLAQQQPHTLSRYGYWVAPGDEPSVSRLAWCYGDLGIAGVLYHTARRIGRQDWLKFAKTLLERCLTRGREQVGDVGLCHGALGIAHIFNRAYQAENDIRYKEAAIRYYAIALELVKQFETTGLRPYADLFSGREYNLSFLQGIIGVALALLSAADGIDPQWDRRLLLSGCPRPS